MAYSTAILQMVSMSLQLVIKQKSATVQSVAAGYPTEVGI